MGATLALPEMSDTLTLPTATRTTAEARKLLEIEDLHVHFVTSHGVVRAVEGVSYFVRPGEIVALVGESGCGKSVSALSILRLLAKPVGRVVRGRILFDGRDLLRLSEEEMRAVRGRDIGMVFQEPMTSLNPVLTIGLQVMEPLKIHLGMAEAEARARAVELMKLVGIPDGERRLEQYPHQLSGGMRQRVMIAIGLACNPKLLIADEPTTALDVTIQAQILELMKDLSRQLGIAMVIITHNLGIVARYADRVNVMYAAEIVEQGSADDVFSRPRHPYTLGLLRSVPRLDRPRGPRLETIEGLPPNLLDPPTGCRFAARCPYAMPFCKEAPVLAEMEAGHDVRCLRAEEIANGTAVAPTEVSASPPAPPDANAPVLLSVRSISKEFSVSGGLSSLTGGRAVVHAVTGVSFEIKAGETLGLVGESGCGKTTIGRMILRLEEPTSGELGFGGEDLVHATGADLKALRTRIQVIFQDPYSSLNPRMTIGQIIAEPLLVYRKQPTRKAARTRVEELLTQVGLYPYMADRYPHQLSGGQRQRVGIARALALEPEFIVCDEPVSALDVSIQGQIINLLEELQQRLGLTYLFIAHDLAVVRHISHKVVVMYLGRVMEMAERDALYSAPIHPYTQALLEAAPVPDAALERARPRHVLGGELPSALTPPQGCVFHTRCPHASGECRAEIPQLREIRPSHWAACIKA